MGWMQWLALSCVLLFSAVTTAQAAHLHTPAAYGHHFQSPAAGSPVADSEEHCPLCVAIHLALPASIPIAWAPARTGLRTEWYAREDGAYATWHFARFSRPPPACV